MRFWETKRLEEMNRAEWESLCDGCARCCLHKLEDEDTDEVFYTDVVCRYLDQDACRCTQYQERNRLVPNCVWLTPNDVAAFHQPPRARGFAPEFYATGVVNFSYLAEIG